MQKLPIGIQSFRKLREENFLYVDKTRHIYELMQSGTFLFFSRPRRFGKSLLLSTLAEIYRGNRALFNGLWIEDKLDWQPRPVILLDFNNLDYHAQSLEVALCKQLDQLASEYEVILKETTSKTKLAELIQRLSVTQQVVLLVDEYDKPITDLLEHERLVAEHVAVLKNFYSVLKTFSADLIHFTLLTGVSKYGKISLFSDLNNLIDLSLDARFATLIGYTQLELESNFSDYLDQIAIEYNATRAETLQQIARWYNGYSWDGKQTLYVPFSTMIFLVQRTFENHWFATATPSFLIKLLRHEQVPAHEIERWVADRPLLDSADVDQISVHALLFQTGYLTIKRVTQSFDGRFYELGYPNHEVEQSMRRYLLVNYLSIAFDHKQRNIVDWETEEIK